MPLLPSKLQISTTKDSVEQESSSSRLPRQRISAWFFDVLNLFNTHDPSKTHGSPEPRGCQIQNTESKAKFEIQLYYVEQKKIDMCIKLISNEIEIENGRTTIDRNRLDSRYIRCVFDKLTKCGVGLVRNGISDIKHDGASLEKIAEKFVIEDRALKKTVDNRKENCFNLLCCPNS
jgi:hypothetical protein